MIGNEEINSVVLLHDAVAAVSDEREWSTQIERKQSECKQLISWKWNDKWKSNNNMRIVRMQDSLVSGNLPRQISCCLRPAGMPLQVSESSSSLCHNDRKKLKDLGKLNNRLSPPVACCG